MERILVFNHDKVDFEINKTPDNKFFICMENEYMGESVATILSRNEATELYDFLKQNLSL